MRARRRISPATTMIVDLSAELDDVLARMHHKSRDNIRLATRNGVTIRTGEASDLEMAYRLLRVTGAGASTPARVATTNRSSKRSPNPATIDSRWPRTKTSRLRSTSPPPSGRRRRVHPWRASVGPTPSPHAELPADVGSNALGQGSRVHPRSTCGASPTKSASSRTEHETLPVTDRTDGLWGVYRFKRGFNGDVEYYVGADDFAYAAALRTHASRDAGQGRTRAFANTRRRGGPRLSAPPEHATPPALHVDDVDVLGY